jgi:hypothetical protein
VLTESSTHLLTGYRSRILSQEVIHNVTLLELEQQFPFSMLNDLRGYINYSPFFFRSFAQLLQRSEFDSDEIMALIPLLGFPSRVKRYALVFILGAHLDSGFCWREKTAAINRFSELIQLCDLRFNELNIRTVEEAVTHYADTVSATERKLLHAKLSVALREYVDFLFLGDQQIGCETAPVQRVGHQSVVVKYFFNLNYGNYIDVTDATLLETYAIGDAPSLHGFRGRLDNIKGYEAIKFCSEEIRGCNANSISSNDALIENIAEGCGQIRAYYDKLSVGELELKKMEMYSLELNRLHEYLTGTVLVIPEEVKIAVVSNATGVGKMKQYATATYSELFFRMLGDAFNYFLS